MFSTLNVPKEILQSFTILSSLTLCTSDQANFSPVLASLSTPNLFSYSLNHMWIEHELIWYLGVLQLVYGSQGSSIRGLVSHGLNLAYYCYLLVVLPNCTFHWSLVYGKQGTLQPEEADISLQPVPSSV